MGVFSRETRTFHGGRKNWTKASSTPSSPRPLLRAASPPARRAFHLSRACFLPNVRSCRRTGRSRYQPSRARTENVVGMAGQTRMDRPQHARMLKSSADRRRAGGRPDEERSQQPTIRKKRNRSLKPDLLVRSASARISAARPSIAWSPSPNRLQPTGMAASFAPAMARPSTCWAASIRTNRHRQHGRSSVHVLCDNKIVIGEDKKGA